jgi:hypothetical protein
VALRSQLCLRSRLQARRADGEELTPLAQFLTKATRADLVLPEIKSQTVIMSYIAILMLGSLLTDLLYF